MAVSCLVLQPVASRAQTATEQAPPDLSGSALKRLSIEELTRISVVSASRHTEPLSQAAAAVTVLTGDAIRRSGATTLPDALRLVTGMFVGRDGQTWAISARGFDATTANKMVVLVDGRSVYTPLYSGVFWDVQDLLLADIDRIEIIRGPGGTLWGANAVNGVINIITKLASDTKGALFEIGAGSLSNVLAGRYGGRAAGGDFRVYGKGRYLNALPLVSGGTPHAPLQWGQGGFRYDRGATAPTSLTIQGDAGRGHVDVADSPNIDANGENVLLRARHTYGSGAQIELQTYYDHTYRHPPQYTEWRNTSDTEVQYRFSWTDRQDVVAGGGMTLSSDRTAAGTVAFSPASRTTGLLDVFARDEITVVDSLHAVIGTKLEHNSYTGFEYQPTARVRWEPARGHVIWGGVSRAVRMPTRFDSDLQFTGGTPAVLLAGNPDFQSETLVAEEAGYRLLAIPKVVIAVNAFWNSYDRLRSEEPTTAAPLPILLENLGEGRTSGFEAAAHYEPLPSWQIWGGFTHLAEDLGFEPGSRDATAGSLEYNDPSQQIWLRSVADLPRGIGFDATVRYVGALPRPHVPAYTELTLHASRAVGRNLDVEIVGDNLLHHQHVEWMQLGPVHAVPRSVYVGLTWRGR